MGAKSSGLAHKTKGRFPLTRTPRRRKRSQRRLSGIYDVALGLPAVSGVSARGLVRPLASFWRVRISLVVGIGLVLLVVLGYWLFLTDDFYVYEITVQGNRLVTSEEIFAASGLDGLSIFWVNPQRVADAVAHLPGILSAEVQCSLPNRVTIVVVEREPQVVWQRAGMRWLVDEQGAVLTAQTGPEGGLVVEDQDSEPLHPGDRVDAAAMAGALQLQRLVPELTAVRYSSGTGLSFRHSLGCEVYLGTGTDMVEKIAILQALVEQLTASGEHPEYIDLRFKEGPCYK